MWVIEKTHRQIYFCGKDGEVRLDFGLCTGLIVDSETAVYKFYITILIGYILSTANHETLPVFLSGCE